MISEVCFEQISGNYCYGAYGEFKVVMMKDNGFVNVTKMCNDGGKRFREWMSNKTSQVLVHTLEEMLGTGKALENTSDTSAQAVEITEAGIPASVIKPIITSNKSDVDKLISGTYLHPDLVPSVAGWISPMFQLKANRVVNGYITCQYKAQLAAAEREVDKVTQENQKLSQSIVNSRKALNVNNIANRLMSNQVAQAEQQSLLAQQQAQKLEVSVQEKEHRHQIWSSTHAFTMMRLNNPDVKHPYYAIRRNRNSMSRAIKKVRVNNPNSIMVYQNSHVANPINLYTRLKASGILKFKGNYCQALVSETDLISKLGELCTITKA